MDHASEGLHNGVLEYPIVTEIQKDYEWELHMGISNGWLMLYLEEKLGPPKELIPLMTILQQNKTEVCQLMDYQELNYHIDVFIANADVCSD